MENAVQCGQVQLIKPSEAEDDARHDNLLVYLPGTDGTGQAILPQVPGLNSLSYDVWCLYLPPDDRSDWEQLTTQLTLLLRQLLQQWRAEHPAAAAAGGAGAAASQRITIVAESFGCCLALRLAASGAGPELLDRLVLLNPATSFNSSLSGLSSLIAATNLLSLFPRDWYAVAQTTLLPLLVDGDRVEEANKRLLQSMILMEPPPSSASFGFGAARPLAAGSGSGDGGRDGAGSGGDGGDGTTLYYAPAAAANFRANLLRSGDPGEEVLRGVAVPVLIVTSARDRLLPSILEGARLERALPNARRFILPDSGHAALLERGFSLAAAMQATGFAPGKPHAATATAPSSSATAAPPTWPSPMEAAGAAAWASASAASAASASASASFAAGSGPSANVQGLQGRPGAGPFATAGSPAVGAAAAAAQGGHSAPHDGSGEPSASEPSSRARGRRASAGAAAAAAAAGGGGGKASARREGEGGGKGGGGGRDEEAPPADIDSAFDEWCQRLAPWRDVVSPVVLGFEHLPSPGSPAFSRPMLFVGNHQRMGFYDTPLLVYELYVRGYRVRGLAHPGHWAGPFGRWFESFGSVKASPLAAFRLLRSAEKVLLFPGGAKEVVKKRGQEYQLLWKDSPDFVRLAARCNALIVPFAAVGADDAYDVIMDTDEVISHPLLGPLTTGLLSRVSSELQPQESIFPITRLPVVGIPTPIPIPNLQRLYFQFAPPIDPSALGTDIHDPQQVQELYDSVRGTVTQCMSELLAVREADDESQLGARLAKSLQRMVPGLGGAAGGAAPSQSAPPPPPQ
ncbi:hypothetical protein PLESTF_001117600 [Pleodorina starrii]|nr:hypothetical protein PLESTF_001117600 [Pleodorina starrii]